MPAASWSAAKQLRNSTSRKSSDDLVESGGIATITFHKKDVRVAFHDGRAQGIDHRLVELPLLESEILNSPEYFAPRKSY
jgi:hypothetical protein